MRNKNELRVEPLDAMILFRPDGTYEVSIPNIVGDDVPDHLFITSALAYALQDDELMDTIMDSFTQECRKKGTSATLSLFPGMKL